MQRIDATQPRSSLAQVCWLALVTLACLLLSGWAAAAAPSAGRGGGLGGQLARKTALTSAKLLHVPSGLPRSMPLGTSSIAREQPPDCSKA